MPEEMGPVRVKTPLRLDFLWRSPVEGIIPIQLCEALAGYTAAIRLSQHLFSIVQLWVLVTARGLRRCQLSVFYNLESKTLQRAGISMPLS